MKSAVTAFFLTVFFSFIGLLIDSNIGMDGNFSVVIAIAVMGSFVVYSLNKNDDDNNENKHDNDDKE